MRLSDFRRPLQKNYTPTELVGGLFPRGYVSVVASKSGVGKTWLVLKIACELSIGGEICGGLSVNEPSRKILILSGETGADFLDKRYAQTNWVINTDNIVIYDIFQFLQQKVSLMLNDEQGQQNFEKIVLNEKPDVVFIDTLISFHRGDENVSKDMAEIFGFLQGVANTYKTAIVVMHHLRKSQKNQHSQKVDQDEVIGSSATNRLSSVIFTITREGNTIFPVNVVQNVKNWNKQIPTFQYIIKNVGGFVDITFDTMSIEPEKNIRYKLSNFIENVWELGKEYKASELAKKLNINRFVLNTYLKEYQNNGRLSARKELNEKNVPVYFYRLIDS